MALFLLTKLSVLGWYIAWFGPSLIDLWFLMKRQPQSRALAAWVCLTLITGFVGSTILCIYLVLTKTQQLASPQRSYKIV
jgi:hypothetical protein